MSITQDRPRRIKRLTLVIFVFLAYAIFEVTIWSFFPAPKPLIVPVLVKNSSSAEATVIAGFEGSDSGPKSMKQLISPRSSAAVSLGPVQDASGILVEVHIAGFQAKVQSKHYTENQAIFLAAHGGIRVEIGKDRVAQILAN